ncbi:plasmid replication protein, partial [Klebsiella pneumoniae]|uniref:plasmid replication protein n=1 Tax=Klebsiella pneumoniae TaxID=573 RepID=UPI00210B0EA1
MKVKNRKRELTAKEYAEQYEFSVSTVKRYVSQDRDDYEKEAHQSRLKAFVLRESGMNWAEV